MPIQRFDKQVSPKASGPGEQATARKGKRKGSKHPWRENIEALTMAVLVALVLKAFIIEVSKIPSGSMQPTLMGNPEASVFDRVIVDKLSFVHRDPERYEVVVFKHPLERSRNMVKRVVGMPGEWLRIENGDLWARASEDQPWQVLRRPESVQEAAWKQLPPRSPVISDWKTSDATRGWRIQGAAIEARGDGEVRFRPTESSIVNDYLDGYGELYRKAMREANAREPQRFPIPRSAIAVGDLRLDGEVRPAGDCREVRVRLDEGGGSYTFVLPGPAGQGGPRILVQPQGGEELELSAAAGQDWRLPPGEWTDFRIENLDDRVRLRVDGEVLVEGEVAAVRPSRSSLAIAVAGDAELDGLEVYRDIHYLPNSRGESVFRIPDGHYFVLGDNTQNSHDAREWQALAVSYPRDDETVEVSGNYRGNGENPSIEVLAQGQRVRFFRDRWGERHRVPADAIDLEARENWNAVPRELIQGRAVCVFWPINPFKSIWRLGWIH